ncbi:MAG: Ferredoxin-2 [Dehalococcoidia bacterium]|nr:Ferredoxin-2 [Chloroflexota bacterium]MBT9161826.1 Ferredoxin-2 [Chloroflexota bacterium]
MGRDIFTKLGNLLDRAGFPNFIQQNDLVALKLHFGEQGTTAYIHPSYVGFMVSQIKDRKALPLLTDTNVLYRSARGNSVDHLHTAFAHGFLPLVTGAPVIISGGLRGQTSIEVEIGKKHFQTVKLASEIADFDKLICLTHFTGHLATGFGGAIKNLGMGLAAKSGKLAMHSTVVPLIKREKCTGCGACRKHCPADAIRLQEGENDQRKLAVIDPVVCLGCGECIAICPSGAVNIQWNESAQNLQEKICEHAYGVVKKKRPVFFLTFLMNITPGCDCLAFTDAHIVPDIGILASYDAVAIDQASVDLVNQQQGLHATRLKTNLGRGEDKLRALYPNVDWTVQLRYGEEIGLGSRDYDLVCVDESTP